MPYDPKDYSKAAVLDRLAHAREGYTNGSQQAGINAVDRTVNDIENGKDPYRTELDFRGGGYDDRPCNENQGCEPASEEDHDDDHDDDDHGDNGNHGDAGDHEGGGN